DALGAAPAGWTASAGTWTVAMDGSHVMKQTDTNTATAKSIHAGSSAWTDYAVKAQIKPGATFAGTANVLSARYADDNNSYGLILKDGSSWYFGKKVAGTWTTLASGSFPYNTSTWYQLEIAAVFAHPFAAVGDQRSGHQRQLGRRDCWSTGVHAAGDRNRHD